MTKTLASVNRREKTIEIERTFKARLEDVWDLWTTKEGIESWWGPDGFSVQVIRINLRPGGSLHYTMTATAPEMIAYMKQNGLPVAGAYRATYRKVVPKRRLAFDYLVDFVPGVNTYWVAHLVELEQLRDGVRVRLSFDRFHSVESTETALMGWQREFEKLAVALASSPHPSRAVGQSYK